MNELADSYFHEQLYAVLLPTTVGGLAVRAFSMLTQSRKRRTGRLKLRLSDAPVNRSSKQ